MRKLIKLFSLLAIVAILATFGLWLVVRSQLTVDNLVTRLESRCNLRAQIGAHATGVLVHPARSLASGSLIVALVVEDLALAERDAVVEAGTPHSQRTAITDENAILQIEKVELEVDLGGLLARELAIRKFILHGVHGAITIDADGADTISPLFAAPGTQAETEEQTDTSKTASSGSSDPRIFLPIPATLNRAAITDSSLVIVNHRQGSRTSLQDFQLELTDIEADTANPEERNHCDIALSAKLAMANLKTDEAFLDFMIRGNGRAEPLDRRDGSFAPSLDAEVTLAKGSSVTGLPLLGMLSGSIEALSRIGLRLGKLDDHSSLVDDMTTSLLYRDGQLLFRKGLELDFERYALGLGEGSWLNLDNLEHQFKGRVTVSEELTAQARDGVETFIRKKAGNTVADAAVEKVLEPLTNAAGRLSLEFVSSGPLPDPSVGIVTQIGDIGDVLETIGESLLRKKGGIEGLLKGLLD